MGDHNTQKMMTSNETHLTVSIDDLIIYKGLSFNLSQIPRFKKVIDLERKMPKGYQPPNRKLISNNRLDLIQYQNLEINFSLIEKYSDIFGLFFLGYGATIFRILILKILVQGESFQ